MRRLDNIVTGGLAGLIVLTPLAFGCVHPWAFAPLEAVIFLLAAAWMVKARRGNTAANRLRRLRWIIATGGAFLAVVLLQIVPLPPTLIRFVSPSTYLLYQRTLPGWPAKAPYGHMSFATGVKRSDSAAAAVAILPVAARVRSGAPVPFARPAGFTSRTYTSAAEPVKRGENRNQAIAGVQPEEEPPLWRTLSIAPGLTYPALLKALAYSALFLLVACYPFDGGAEERFYKVMLGAVLFAGIIVALVGLIERAAWNGKILWFFVPIDPGALDPQGVLRARGPFVDPDHFADYLAMVLPLTLAAALFPTALSPRRKLGGFRIICAAACLVIAPAIVLSLSRAGWAAAAVGAGVFFGLLWTAGSPALLSNTLGGKPYPRGELALSRRAGHRSLAVPLFGAVGVIGLLAASFFLIGSAGRLQTGARLHQTAAVAMFSRLSAWKDSVRMVRDFPVFGVGLGAWPELFPRYRSSPWWPQFMRAAHNDYVQLLAETGFVGFFTLTGLFVLAAREVWRRFPRLSRAHSTMVAAMLGGVGAIGVHELVDFSFRIPANAVLFTIFVGLALRMTVAEKTNSADIVSEPASARATSAWPLGAAAFLLVLALAAVEQRANAYPYDVPAARTPSEAVRAVVWHPASSAAHLSLAVMLGNPQRKLEELATAVWLDPSNPYSRDVYAQYLSSVGKVAEAARQITLSILSSPDSDSHFYLDERLILWLSPGERQAVESGFRRAIAADYPGAVGGLARFYATLGRFPEEAKLYARAAARERNASRRAAYLVAAGAAYARAGEYGRAESALLSAEHGDPANPVPYESLVSLVYGPRKNLAAAQTTVEQGIDNGIDPSSLYDSLAAVAEQMGNSEAAERALAKAVSYEATTDNLLRLGSLYLDSGKIELAVATLRKTVDMHPDSAPAYHLLAVAEERNYEYVAAGHDYARAIDLDPGDRVFRQEYASFRQRMSGGSSAQ